MQIRMMKTAAGPEGTWPAGSVRIVDDDVGQQLIDAGAAVRELVAPVEESDDGEIKTAEAEPETKTADAPAQRAPKRRRRTTK